MRRALGAGLVASAVLFSGCGDDIFQRMKVQPKAKAYGESEVFADGRAMRTPPAGTVPKERLKELSIPGAKTAEGQYHARVPVPVTMELLAKGRHRFETVCANCHGLLGDGESLPGRNMALRPPPSLVALTKRPPGFLYEAITEGYGLMIPFKAQLPAEERWAVVAYVLALQRSQAVDFSLAPPEVQSKLNGGLR